MAANPNESGSIPVATLTGTERVDINVGPVNTNTTTAAIAALASGGNAATATALQTGRTFALTGGATGTSAAFNGTANASIPVTLSTPTATVRGGVLQEAHIDPATGTTTDIINALIAAGVLAAS